MGAGRILFRFGHFRPVLLATVSDHDDREALRESRTAKAAEEHRDYLSEFCHPNSDAFAQPLRVGGALFGRDRAF